MLIIGQARLKPDATACGRPWRFARRIRPAISAGAPARLPDGGTGAKTGTVKELFQAYAQSLRAARKPSAGAKRTGRDLTRNYQAAGKPQREWRYRLFNHLLILRY
jgi:hypothetical protein